MKAVIEVGANLGTDTERLVKEYPDSIVISFEPVPELAKTLQQKYPKHHERVIFYEGAVSNISGLQKFNITATSPNIKAKYGSSSLYFFDDNLKNIWDRADFTMEKQILVKVYRLDNIIEEHNITSIEYLHCDAQGNDLNVLESLGSYAPLVKKGVIEVTNKVPLYKNCNNTYERAKNVLEKLGFEITSIIHNDKKEAEMNIYFRRNKDAENHIPDVYTKPQKNEPFKFVTDKEEATLDSYLKMVTEFYNSKSSEWNINKKNSFPTGKYNVLNEWNEYDNNFFRTLSVDQTKNMMAFDYGCAPGRLIEKYSYRFKQIDGCDISKNLIEKTKENIHSLSLNSNVKECDGMSIPFEDDSYDVVFSSLVLQHIPVFEVRNRILKDMYRIMKNDGYLYLQMAFGGRRTGYFSKYSDNVYWADGSNGKHDVSIMETNEVTDHLNEIGFSDIKINLTPSGPNCSHKKWIWIEARK